MSHKTYHYASDLTNAQWVLLAALQPNRKGQVGRPMELALREVVNAIFYVLRTGCQWRNLPQEYPNSKSVYYHYRKWCVTGTWERLNRGLVYLERKRQGRLPHPSATIIDSQSSKTTESGGERGYDGGKKVTGRKRHILVVVVHAANTADCVGAKAVFQQLPPMWQRRLRVVWADGGYEGDLWVWLYTFCRIVLSIVRRSATQTLVGRAYLCLAGSLSSLEQRL